MSVPLQVAAVPGPHQALREEEDEDQHRHQSARRQTGEGDGEGQEEQYLDVEDQEEDRVEIVVRLELDPRVAGGLHPAFVDVGLQVARLRWLEELEPQLGDAERHEGERDRDDDEEREESVRMRHVGRGCRG
jgi:hypothetical protein